MTLGRTVERPVRLVAQAGHDSAAVLVSTVLQTGEHVVFIDIRQKKDVHVCDLHVSRPLYKERLCYAGVLLTGELVPHPVHAGAGAVLSPAVSAVQGADPAAHGERAGGDGAARACAQGAAQRGVGSGGEGAAGTRAAPAPARGVLDGGACLAT